MLGVHREHQAVEEAPALGRRAVEQRVHRRRQPDDAQVIGESGGRRHRLAVDAVARGGATPRRPAHRCRCRAWPAPACPRSRRRWPTRRRPRRRPFPPGWRGAGRAPAPERNRLDQVGLAGAVGARQHHRPGAVERHLRGVVAAEVRQRQAADEGGGHRSLIDQIESRI